MSGIEIYLAETRVGATPSPTGPSFEAKQFRCWAQLETDPDSPIGGRAIIDTGACFSIVPRSRWDQNIGLIEFVTPLDATSALAAVEGITGPKVPCRFGWVRIMLGDRRLKFSDWLRIPAKLVDLDNIPLILGIAGLLDSYEIVLNAHGRSHILVPICR